MESLEFNNLPVVELTHEDSKNVEGGWVWPAIGAYILGEVIDGVVRYASGERSR